MPIDPGRGIHIFTRLECGQFMIKVFIEGILIRSIQAGRPVLITLAASHIYVLKKNGGVRVYDVSDLECLSHCRGAGNH